MQIPLMVRAPGVAAGRVASIAHITDVMPTILELCGLAAPRVDGISLLTAIRGGAGRREAYAESMYPRRLGWSSLQAIRDDRYKFIAAPRPELYDLDADPFEQSNIAADRPGVVAAMQRRLSELAGTDSAATDSVSPEVRARLASLGYAAGARSSATAHAGGLPDPKDCIAALAAAAVDETTAVRARVPCR